jgi:hypothetical protein
MKQDNIQFDEYGNFRLDGDIETQWMQLHRDIQAEYRSERWHAFFKAGGLVAAAIAIGYLVFQVAGIW